MSRRELLIFLTVLVAAFAIRLCFVPTPGYENDTSLFKVYSQQAIEQGVPNVYENPPAGYPPVYMYVLKGVGAVNKFFDPAYKMDAYLLNLLIKFPPIMADLLVSAGIFFFLRKKNAFNFSLLMMSAYAFNPAVIFDSAFWGQMDSVLILFYFGAVLAMESDQYCLAWILGILAALTKLQGVFILPVLFLVTWKRKGFKELINGLSTSWWTSVVVMSVFLWNHKVDKIIDHVFSTVGVFPFLSLYAFNVWWLFGGKQGGWLLDTSRFLHILTYRSVGMLMFVAVFALILRYLYINEKNESAVFFSSAMIFFSFFMLCTEMHERYILLPLALLLMAASRSKSLRVVYGLLSLSAFVSLMFVLSWAYPKNLFHLPPLLQPFPDGIVFSVINLMLFLYLFYLLIRDIKIKYLACGLAVVIFAGSLMYFIKPTHPVYLSDVTPITSAQQWGSLHMDRSVDGGELRANGFYYKKGIGTHALSTLEYDLNGKFHRLEGAVALDDEASSGNLIEAWIYADDKLIYDSGKFSGWINPHYFHLNISGTKILKLVITDGGDGITRDHGDWLGIKVLP